MTDVTVPLSRTYGETGRAIKALSFRSPRWQDFLDLGPIEEWQPVDMDADGRPTRMMLVRHYDVVGQYAERCLKEPAAPADLAMLDIDDTIAVCDAIRDFFTSARSSRKPPTNSSGDTEKASTKSGD
jgi:hypothetical protein